MSSGLVQDGGARYADLPCAPALLLESKFDASITDAPEFRAACTWGYVAYCNERWHTVDGVSGYVEQRLSGVEVQGLLADEYERACEAMQSTSLACRAGFWLGWLSAYAQECWSEAVAALEVLTALVTCWQACYQQEQAGGLFA
jgi:hypothetical protein